jgi:hypothetical protein
MQVIELLMDPTILAFVKYEALNNFLPQLETLTSELFGPGHFVGLGLGLRLKSEIRIWNSDLGPRFGTLIWDPDFGP